ncbi:hypothetical protein D3C71_2033360 [compost metagenome]
MTVEVDLHSAFVELANQVIQVPGQLVLERRCRRGDQTSPQFAAALMQLGSETGLLQHQCSGHAARATADDNCALAAKVACVR